jgi:hypothetical protein
MKAYYHKTSKISEMWNTTFLKTGYIIFLLLFLPVLSRSMAAETVAESAPSFFPGEKLSYNLRWGFIPAGRATLAVLPITQFYGQPAHHFLLTAESNSFIDAFYKVRDRIESFTDLEVSRSLAYVKKQREGRTHNDIVVNFNWDEGTAQRSNFGEVREPIRILPGSLDPLAVFFFARKLALQPGVDISNPVTDGKKCVIGIAHIVKRESITVPAGTFDTYLMEPDLKDVGGVFEKSKNAKMQLWVTTDHRRTLIRLRSKVLVGSFVGELTSVEHGQQIQVSER